MGKIGEGVYGGLSGKTGNLVGSSWKGIHYLRINPQTVRNPRTESQIEQRNKVKLIVGVLRPVLLLLRMGFKNDAVKMSAYNAAFSYNIQNAITGDSPNLEVDWTALRLSQGHLLGVETPTVTVANSKISFQWTDNSGEMSAKSTDVVMPVVYNIDKGYAVFGTGGTRISELCDVAIPTSWVDDTVAMYLSVFSVETNEVSDSVYLGQEIAA